MQQLDGVFAADARGGDDVFIIAEAGVNHNGELEKAFALVDVAADAGADCVKFQTYKAEGLSSRHAAMAGYQKKNTGADEAQLDMLRRLELSYDDAAKVKAHCEKRGIVFLSTPFEIPSFTFLHEKLGLKTVKIGSGDMTNAPLLFEAARNGCRVILSTGMATMDEVRIALDILAHGYIRKTQPRGLADFAGFSVDAGARAVLADKVYLLHCTTEYPTPFEHINLRAMETLRAQTPCRVGFSDHSVGIEACVAAVAMGARVLEKHFTLDKNLPGPDHKASLDPVELRALVSAVRNVSKSLGSAEKSPNAAEIKNVPIARKSVLTLRAVQKGEVLDETSLGTKRPESGLKPWLYWDVLGRKAARDLESETMIVRDDYV